MLSRLSSFSGPLSKLFTAIKGFTLNGLILRYEISDRDSYSGTTTVTDLVSNSNATLTNGPTYSINGYLNLDGVNDYVMTNTSLNSKLSPNSSSTIISVFTWIYPQDNGVIITEQGDTSLNGLGWHTSIIEIVSSQLKFSVWPLTSIITSSISLNNWNYVGLTYDGTTLRGYIDGQLAGSAIFTREAPPNLHYAIAAEDSTDLGDSTYAKMKFGAFHVYNKALSNQEVVSNYNYTKSNYIYTGSMSIWIDANDPASFSGGSLIDLSGNGYTHSLTSSATSSTIFGFKSFDCSTGSKRIVVDGTGPTLSTSGYTYVVWARAISDNSSFRTLLYTKSPRYTPITIPSGTNTLGYWDTEFRSSGHGLTSSVEVWTQYAVVGDNSSQTFYINDSQVGNSISYGAGGTLHDGLGNNLGSSQSFGHVGNMMLYNKKLTLEEIKQNYDALKNVYKNGNFVIDNLVLYFNPASYLSYPSAGTTITDLTGNSLNGAMSNITFTNPYLTFNGLNSQVTITDNSLLETGSSNWTMEAWFKTNITSGSQVVLGKFSGGGGNEVSYSIRIGGSNLFCQIGNGLGSTLNTHYSNSTNYTITAGTWYQVVYVYSNSGDTLKTYINGSLVSSVASTIGNLLNNSANLYLGSFNNGEYSQYFDGQMGIVRIYNSALSDSDVSKNFEANRDIYGI